MHNGGAVDPFLVIKPWTASMHDDELQIIPRYFSLNCSPFTGTKIVQVHVHAHVANVRVFLGCQSAGSIFWSADQVVLRNTDVTRGLLRHVYQPPTIPW
jgi:hypothetical protein